MAVACQDGVQRDVSVYVGTTYITKVKLTFVALGTLASDPACHWHVTHGTFPRRECDPWAEKGSPYLDT